MKSLIPILATVACLSLAGCGGSPAVTSPAEKTSNFSNVLVITVAGDYNNRAQFERAIVSNIRHTGASASAWYSVIGGNKPVARDDVIAAIEERGFDAVLAVRRLDGDIEMKVKRSRTEIDATPIGGRIVNLFRSEYTDYTTPESVNFAASAVLAVEFYGAESRDIVFSFDHQTKSETNFGLLIDETAATIVRRLDREKLLASGG